jgi:hypothetical protein
MKGRFYIMPIKSKQLDDRKPVIDSGFLSVMANQLVNLIDIKIIPSKQLILTLKPNAKLPVFKSLSSAKKGMDKTKFQLCVELNDNNEIIAMYEGYFALLPLFKLYRIATDQLYLKDDKHFNFIYQSLCYGLLKELANHNAGDKTIYKRGLALLDYLYIIPQHKLHRIVKKSEDSYLLATHYLKTRAHVPAKAMAKIDHEAMHGGVPVINFNDINFDVLKYALETVGSFILVGVSVSKFKLLGAIDILDSSRKIFKLTEGQLYKVYNEDFNGYQDVQLESLGRAMVVGSGEVRNSFDYHIKPYDLRSPKAFDMRGFVSGYDEAFALQQTLYRIMAVHFKIDPQHLPNYLTDTISVLTTRVYFETTYGTIGSPSHSDYNLLSLAYANGSGLEVRKDNQWTRVGVDDVLIRMGDWGLFSLKDIKFKAGLHRVLDVDKKHHSFAFFLNPSKNQKLVVTNCQEVTYETYLKSAKVPYTKPKSK